MWVNVCVEERIMEVVYDEEIFSFLLMVEYGCSEHGGVKGMGKDGFVNKKERSGEMS